MNLHQFTAIVFMRWRITWNRFTRSGITNQVLAGLVAILAILGSAGGFLFATFFGSTLFGKIDSFNAIYAWDVVVALFLFGWAGAVLTELQRSEALSFKNLLHLPVSLFGAFLLNYVSSLVSVTIFLIAPAMFGLALAAVIQFGAGASITFALVVAFLGMVSAVSYQIRGWLARLMENKRTRGTVIVITTIGFVLLFQIPMFLNTSGLRSWGRASQERRMERMTEMDDLRQRLASGEIDSQQHQALVKSTFDEYTKRELAIMEADKAALRSKTILIHRVLPPLWLPYGASAAARGNVFTSLMCLLGMSAIGLTSLTLSYRSTLRTAQGDATRKYRAEKRRGETTPKTSMLQWNVPMLRSTQSAIMMTTLRSTFRAPEAKMAMLTPLIFAFIFGSMIVTGPMSNISAFARPWLGLGAIAMSLTGVSQMMFNMFGLDRQGFRAYVLMPVPRRDILIGKNLGILTIGCGLSIALVLVVGIVVKLQPSHQIANLLQVVIASLVYCTVTNHTSIFAAVGLASGTMKPTSIKFSVAIVQLIAMLVSPLALVPAILALGLEVILNLVYDVDGIPIYLLLTVVQIPLAILYYRKMIQIQSQQLQEREQLILQEIAKVSDA